jgi:hypothetical protein
MRSVARARRKALDEVLAWLAALLAIVALGLAVWTVVEEFGPGEQERIRCAPTEVCGEERLDRGARGSDG